MKTFLVLSFGLTLIVVAQTALPASGKFKKFEQDYAIVHQDLLNQAGEVATVKDFVYTKDIATLTFQTGEIHFERYIDGRPTTAIFFGKGYVQINVPSHVERHSLFTVSKDSVVNDSFTTCFIHMADDFDIKVKERFPFRNENLSWSDYNLGSKLTQGEYLFNPTIGHVYDNYFQLLRSAYERKEDGFFWVNFDRYCYIFDPNRPEQVHVSYQWAGGDIIATEGAVLQRKESGVYDDSDMSQLAYTVRPVRKEGRFEMAGADGLTVVNGEGHVVLVVEADSLRFLSLFLHHNLKTDSASCNGEGVDFHRRKDFRFIGIILPAYVHRGDTLDVALWYKGSNYDDAFPYTEDPRAVPHSFSLTFAKGYSYYLPDSATVQAADGKKRQLTVVSSRPYNRYPFQAYAGGCDTIQIESGLGIPLNFVEPTRTAGQEYDDRRSATLSAFNFAGSLLGPPASASSYFVCLDGISVGMPGILIVPNTRYSDFSGGFYASAGEVVGQQWFAAPVSSAGDRELWLFGALPAYVCLMLVQDQVGNKAFYTNLLERRNALYSITERGVELPLATGSRALATTRVNKGVWVLHMLRWLMCDLQTGSDENFRAFLKETGSAIMGPSFTNADFVALAEKHYGGSLASFFQYWLYSTGMPEFDVDYRIEQQGNEYFVNGDVVNKTADASFQMPVLFRVVSSDQTTFLRHLIKGAQDSFSLGPFGSPPTEVYFNEFYSVLSKDQVDRK